MALYETPARIAKHLAHRLASNLCYLKALIIKVIYTMLTPLVIELISALERGLECAKNKDILFANSSFTITLAPAYILIII